MKIQYALLIGLLYHGNTIGQANDSIPITIWVHGTISGPNFILHDFFYRELGMIKAADYKPRYHSRDIALSLCNADPMQYQFEHFYFWGWSGKLSKTARKNEARQLYLDLLKLIAQYKEKYSNRPLFIRLISHSHGGNLLLNLALAQDTENSIIFDELIILSCPVQYATKDFAASNCFKKIYAFYSADLYQIIDFQRIKKGKRTLKMHSARRFPETPNIHQAKIKINGWALFHVEFMLHKFLKHVPRLCTEIDAFYNDLSLEHQQREKLLHVQYCNHCNQVIVHRKLF